MNTQRVSVFLVSFFIFLIVIAVGSYLYINLKSNRVEQIAREEGVIRVLFLFREEKELVDMSLMFFGREESNAIGGIVIPRNTAMLQGNPPQMLPIDTTYAPTKMELFREEVEAWINLSIHYVVSIDVADDFSNLIDLVQGTYTTLVDGPRTLIDGSDYRRLQNSGLIDYQDLLVELLLVLAAEESIIQSSIGYSLLRTYMESTMSRDELTTILLYTKNVNRNETITIQLRGLYRAVSGVDELLLFPHEDGFWLRNTLSALNETILDNDIPNRFLITVEVLNGTRREGLARRTANHLFSMGFQFVSVGNAGSNTVENTEIFGSTVTEKELRYVQDILEIEQSQYISSLEQVVDVTISLGNDFDEAVIR